MELQAQERLFCCLCEKDPQVILVTQVKTRVVTRLLLLEPMEAYITTTTTTVPQHQIQQRQIIQAAKIQNLQAVVAAIMVLVSYVYSTSHQPRYSFNIRKQAS